MKPVKTFLLSGAVAVGLFAIIGASPALAKPSGGGTTSATCPNGNAGGLTDNNLAASFSTTAGVTTYTFSSFGTENPSAALIGYCVYPPSDNSTQPSSVTALFDSWVANRSNKKPFNFSFVRPTGSGASVPIDGTPNVPIGSVQWGGTVPTPQTFLLHITGGVCGAGNTCFVKPSPGPVCDQGDSSVAYNAMPFDVVNCLNPGVAFEANGWNEFGDSVTLKAGTSLALKSLIVDFQSFACVTGTWNNQGGNNLCGGGTTQGVSPGTFTWPITAKIYAADGSGLPAGSALATTTSQAQIPFRPNADATNCPSTPEKWFNPLAPGGGACQNSIATKLTFDLSGLNVTLPADGKVVWTVAFDTSTSGYSPQGTTTPACAFTAATPGSVCPVNPADSLNVGDKSYAGAPYAGASLFDTNGGLAVGSKGQPPSALAFFTPDDNGRPLGEIITGP